MHHFELYILTDTVTIEHWEKLYQSIFQASGNLPSFDLTFRCTDNVVRFFLSSAKDLGSLSNNIEGFVLRPVAESEVKPPATSIKERFVQFVTGGNLLDLKEKYATTRSKDLQYAVFHIKAFSNTKAITRSSLYFKGQNGQWFRAGKVMTIFPARLLAIDFTTNSHYLKKTIPYYLNIEKSLHMLTSDSKDAIFAVDTFPYFSQPLYLGITDYEFDKHSFIIGATGSGKSKLISLYVDRLYKTALRNNCRVVIIDPHSSLQEDIAHLQDTKIINFNSESAELFSDSATDLTAATELTATLFASLLGDQFNARLDRTLRFSLFVLFTAQSMSLDTLKRFLTDIDLRNQVIQHVTGYVPNNIVHFFGSDYNEIQTKYYNEAIMPIVSLIDELQLQPALVKKGDVSLAKTIQDHYLTVFSLNKVSMGEKTVKTVSGLLIQQIFLLAQARVLGQKIILVIDEVSVVQNPALASILAEARKFNLTVILTQQYFGQIEKSLQAAIFANVYNYYVFKVSEEDARALEGNLNIELPKALTESGSAKGLKEADLRVKIMTELHPRECLLRLSAKGQVNPALKARTVDAPKPTSSKHEEIVLRKAERQELPSKFVESSAPAKPAVTQQPGSEEQQPPAASITEPEPDEVKRGGSLSALLSRHSSSRINLRKRKEK